jgi:hypothetical protein
MKRLHSNFVANWTLFLVASSILRYQANEAEDQDAELEDQSPAEEELIQESDSVEEESPTRGTVDPARTRVVDPARTRVVDPARTRVVDPARTRR